MENYAHPGKSINAHYALSSRLYVQNAIQKFGNQIKKNQKEEEDGEEDEKEEKKT